MLYFAVGYSHIFVFSVLETCIAVRNTCMGPALENAAFEKSDFVDFGFFWPACARNCTFGNISLYLSIKIAKTVFRPVPRFGHVSDPHFFWLFDFFACMRAKPHFRQQFSLFLVAFTTTAFRDMTRGKKGGGNYVRFRVNPKQQAPFMKTLTCDKQAVLEGPLISPKGDQWLQL